VGTDWERDRGAREDRRSLSESVRRHPLRFLVRQQLANQQWPDDIIDLSVGKGMAQPCGLVMSTAIPIGEIVLVRWYNDS
jgi:hypothetical protein